MDGNLDFWMVVHWASTWVVLTAALIYVLMVTKIVAGNFVGWIATLVAT